MTKTHLATPVTPSSLTREYRERLIEDVFASTFHYVSNEDTLRAMSRWFQTMQLFLDTSVLEAWERLPVKSEAGTAAYTAWTELNSHAQRLKEAGDADQ